MQVATLRRRPASRTDSRSLTTRSVGVGAIFVAAMFGVAIPRYGVVVLLPGGLGLLFVAWRWPTTTVTLSIVAAALHSGIFLALRLSVGGAPLSLFDMVPSLVLVSAISIRSRDPSLARGANGAIKLVMVVVGAGTALGAIMGFAYGNPSYLVLQVLRLEVQLFLVLIACAVAGNSPRWREAVVRGIIWGGVLAAVEILVAFFFSVVTGSSFWSLFPFGDKVSSNLQRDIATGDLAPLRQNPVSAFLLLPPLALVATRVGPRDGMLTGLFIAAGVVWLSRSFWAALALMLAIVLAFCVKHRRADFRNLLRRLAPLIPIAFVVVVVAGGIVEQRFQQATIASVSTDQSTAFRAAETQAALQRITSTPFQFVFGLGTGTVIEHPYLRQRAAPSALLENGVLSEWANGGLAVMLGSALLFFGAGLRGWRSAARTGPRDARGALALLSLALPVLWLEGLVGGTLQLLEPTTILWLLAGTAMVQRSDPTWVPLGPRRAQPSIREPRHHERNGAAIRKRHARPSDVETGREGGRP